MPKLNKAQKAQIGHPYYGGGMPKGHKTAKTLEKEEARALARQIILDSLRPMLEAQIANAQGIKYLVSRDKQTGKFTRITEEQAEKLGTTEMDEERKAIEVWEKDPNVSAFTDLLNRALDKPKEQEQEHKVTGQLQVYGWAE